METAFKEIEYVFTGAKAHYTYFYILEMFDEKRGLTYSKEVASTSIISGLLRGRTDTDSMIIGSREFFRTKPFSARKMQIT